MINKYKSKFNAIPRAVKVSMMLLICGILQKGISLITTPIFTRLLDTSEFGEFSLYTSWTSILIVFITLNLSAGVYTQGYIKFDKQKDDFTSSLIGLTILFVLASYLLYLTNVNYWNTAFGLNTIMMNCMFISLLMSTLFGFWEAQQRVNLYYKAYVFITILVSILKPLTGIVTIFLFPEYKVEMRILSMTLVEVVAYIIPIISLFKKSIKLYNGHYWVYALKFNIPLIPHYLSQSVLSQSDRIMISKFCTTSEVGIYSLSYNLSMLLTIVNNSVLNVFSPHIYKAIKNNQLVGLGEKSYFLLILVATLNLFLILVAPEAISFFAPSSYSGAIWVVPPVAMSVYFMFMYSMFANFSFYFEKTVLIMVASVLAAISNILLNFIFIPIFGYIAAAYTTLFCYIIFDIFHYVMMKKVCNIYLDGIRVYKTRVVLLISTVFMVIGFSFMLLYKYIIIRYALILVLAYCIFLRKDKIISLIKDIKK